MLPFMDFTARFKIPLYPWQADAFGQATRRVDGRFAYRLAGSSMPRGNGKSWGSAAVGLWCLVCGPRGQDIISSALDLDGARVVLEHARAMVRAHRTLAKEIDVRANGLFMDGCRWTITSREHTASRGRHPHLIIYDEAGWARDDELFASLAAGQASIDDPLMLVVSTVGRRKRGPLWTVKALAEGGDPSTYWYWRGENLSPKVTPAFLERQRRILLAAQYAREHQNAWIDAADSFTSAIDVDAAMHAERIDIPPGTPEVMFVDLGTVHDPSVIATGARVGDVIVITRLETFQGSHESPVKIADVERRVRAIPAEQIRIESWQGVQAAQQLSAAGRSAELYTPTAKKHAEEWPLLAQQLAARALILPKHARLREELLNLVVEVGPSGVRVVDRGQVHQDHAVAVRGVVAMLAGGDLLTADERIRMLSIGGKADPLGDLEDEELTGQFGETWTDDEAEPFNRGKVDFERF